MIELIDHLGRAAQQHRVLVNGIEMHAVSAGKGPALLLIHGTPKTHIYWREILPLLTPHFRVIAPDLRGAGLSGHPYAESGYVSDTVAEDLAQLLDALQVGQIFVHGEDRGAEYGFVLAAKYPDRVKALSFAEMMLSGYGLEERSFLTEENVRQSEERRGVWEWHVPFFFKPDVPEMLIAGKEREFWTYWLNLQSYDPTSLPDDLRDEWIALLSTPHGLRGTLHTYKATLENAKVNHSIQGVFPRIPVMTIGASHFFAGLVRESIERIGVTPAQDHVLELCGHSLALEQPAALAELLKTFFNG
ncbi:alpha/beta hydrolase [Novosphingobium sp.]|jgi:pimeloyl-ACP methyl ester carboxylesterase|uniref:alpha/beta hydrolase n=1 Tax=Novosphingobium sp. TaxID=1874826 RepID=UPI0028A88B3D|nr:alpha/beta hydrolase [Novosphingobium sp.]